MAPKSADANKALTAGHTIGAGRDLDCALICRPALLCVCVSVCLCVCLSVCLCVCVLELLLAATLLLRDYLAVVSAAGAVG